MPPSRLHSGPRNLPDLGPREIREAVPAPTESAGAAEEHRVVDTKLFAERLDLEAETLSHSAVSQDDQKDFATFSRGIDASARRTPANSYERVSRALNNQDPDCPSDLAEISGDADLPEPIVLSILTGLVAAGTIERALPRGYRNSGRGEPDYTYSIIRSSRLPTSKNPAHR